LEMIIKHAHGKRPPKETQGRGRRITRNEKFPAQKTKYGRKRSVGLEKKGPDKRAF